MTQGFLNNAAHIVEGFARLPAMTYDIDVVGEVAAEIERRTGKKPRIVSRRLLFGQAHPTDADIPVDEVENLSKARRRTLLVIEDSDPEYANQLHVDFQNELPTTISGPTELVAHIAHHLQAEGTGRPAWKRALPVLPLCLALIFTIATVLTLVFEGAGPLPALSGTILIVIVWGAAAWAASHLRRQTTSFVHGARFRETSRAAFRERVTSLRANALVAGISTPIGAVIGWFLNTWLGG